jgi:hypothetical protein
MESHHGHGQWRKQATDDQGCSSGKVNGVPNVFPIEAQFPPGFLRFPPMLNNPWILATERRWAAAGPNNCTKSRPLG